MKKIEGKILRIGQSEDERSIVLMIRIGYPGTPFKPTNPENWEIGEYTEEDIRTYKEEMKKYNNETALLRALKQRIDKLHLGSVTIEQKED